MKENHSPAPALDVVPDAVRPDEDATRFARGLVLALAVSLVLYVFLGLAVAATARVV